MIKGVIASIMATVMAICGIQADSPIVESVTEVAEQKIEEIQKTEVEKPIEPEKPKPFDITMTFTGDAMLACYKDQTTAGSFNDYVNKHEPTYFLEKVKHIFEADDITVVNLENVLSDRNLTPAKKEGKRVFWFKSKTSNTDILTSSSVEAVSLANNHYGDYGTAGREDTKKAVIDAGLEYGYNDHTFYYEKNGYTIAFICHGLWGEWQANEIVNRIKEAEKVSDFQVVFYHGGKEGILMPEEWKVRASRKLVDNGADLVVGNHPHVLQPKEVYHGVDIIYSMGNFCYGGHRHPKNRTIIYQLTLTVDPNDNKLISTKSNMIPCYVYTGKDNNYQPAVIEDEAQKQKVLDFMSWKANNPY